MFHFGHCFFFLEDWKWLHDRHSHQLHLLTHTVANTISVSYPMAPSLHCLRLFTFIFLMTAGKLTAITDTIFKEFAGDLVHVCVVVMYVCPSPHIILVTF